MKKLEKIKQLVDSINQGEVVIVITKRPEEWRTRVMEECEKVNYLSASWNLSLDCDPYQIDLYRLNWIVQRCEKNNTKGVFFTSGKTINKQHITDQDVHDTQLTDCNVKRIYSFIENRELNVDDVFFHDEFVSYNNLIQEYVQG